MRNSNRTVFMKKRRRLIILILIAIVLLVIMIGYFGCSRNEVMDSSIKTIEIEERGHLDLLFWARGEVEFDHEGRQIQLYIANYAHDELLLHENIGGVRFLDEPRNTGSIFWGITSQNNLPHELHTWINLDDGSSVRGFFDLSTLEMEEVGPRSNLTILKREIEHGHRYALHIQHSGTFMTLTNNVFDPQYLRQYENSIIFYVVFN